MNVVSTVSKGKHSLTFGTQNTFNNFRTVCPNYNGAYRFASLQDFYNSANNGTANATRYELRYSARKGGEFPYADVSTCNLDSLHKTNGTLQTISTFHGYP